jgi:hypothetical protein
LLIPISICSDSFLENVFVFGYFSNGMVPLCPVILNNPVLYVVGHIDHSARVMRVITWNRSFRGVPGLDDGKDDFDIEEHETHATVLDKMLAWEKKLFDEVKVWCNVYILFILHETANCVFWPACLLFKFLNWPMIHGTSFWYFRIWLLMFSP